MTKATIEQLITKAYAGESGGDWVVEKGKVKECRLLKEAVQRIEELKKRNQYLNDQISNEGYEVRMVEKKWRKKYDDLRGKYIRLKSAVKEITNAINEVE